MRRGSVSAASLWGLPQWSPAPNCHTSLEQLTSQSASRGDLPLIPLKEVGDLVRPLGEEDPGLLAALADYQGHKCGGVLVPLLRSAPTVGAVLSQLIRYNPIHASPVIWQVRADGDYVFMAVWLEAEVAPVDSEVRELLVTMALMHVTSGLASITGGAFKPESIHLGPSGSDFDWPTTFQSIPVIASSPESGLRIHRDVLRRPNQGYEKPHLVSLRDADVALENFRTHDSAATLKSEIKGWIRAALPTGRYQLTRLAERMHCDKRTLQRRLVRELDETFQSLLDESRDEVVLPMLESGVFPVSLISTHAGFSNTGNFSRYFSHRFGCSPLAWCAQK